MRLGKPRRPLADRFWERVCKTDACWEWSGCKDKDGYGKIVRAGGNGPEVRTHRLSWELEHGPVPEGLKVLHRCDNPSCVRPDHLFLGTTADNQQDMMRKGRSTRGSRSARAKLNEDTVLSILDLLHDGIKQARVARMFGLDKCTINHIWRGRTWRHVGAPA